MALSCRAVGESGVKVTTQRLEPSDRHLILGSAGLWQIITAEEAGLRLYASAMMPSRGRNVSTLSRSHVHGMHVPSSQGMKIHTMFCISHHYHTAVVGSFSSDCRRYLMSPKLSLKLLINTSIMQIESILTACSNRMLELLLLL